MICLTRIPWFHTQWYTDRVVTVINANGQTINVFIYWILKHVIPSYKALCSFSIDLDFSLKTVIMPVISCIWILIPETFYYLFTEDNQRPHRSQQLSCIPWYRNQYKWNVGMGHCYTTTGGVFCYSTDIGRVVLCRDVVFHSWGVVLYGRFCPHTVQSPLVLTIDIIRLR